MASVVERRPGFSIEATENDPLFDDDGRPRRTGTWLTASAHIITAVIGSGVLSLPWCNAQLGWIAGPMALVLFSVVTTYSSSLLANCYRYPDRVTGTRNYIYSAVVKVHLGGTQSIFCGIAQYLNMVGTTIGYTITASISMVAIKRSHCFHSQGHKAGCHTSNNMFMIIFGVIQIVLSQIPSFAKLDGLSIVAAVMSFSYSLIGIGLAIAKIAGGNHPRTSITGTSIGVDLTSSEKGWKALQAIGDIAFAYSFSAVLVEIQDTLRSHPPEYRAMKKAINVGVSITTLFYLSCGVLGYAAFGNLAPGNLLTGFGFYEPFWLIDIGNLCIAIHLICAYQVFCQPFYDFVEKCCSDGWPKSALTAFFTKERLINIPFGGVYKFSFFRLIWRTTYVVIITLIAMIFPLFNDVLALIGAISFWPLTVHFPIEMHISKNKIGRFSMPWVGLRVLSGFCFLVSLAASIASIQGLVQSLDHYKPLHSVS
ncbi:amino acid permease 6-like [Tripterygium wilfordii]|uniref:amino acid permease 6-like n=1 Tax=Tripterygium wilfordii TaxID=458696 RepID=UPI0018F81046|nr:amino acid permease 6-like [Tripterygium wilfordii]